MSNIPQYDSYKSYSQIKNGQSKGPHGWLGFWPTHAEGANILVIGGPTSTIQLNKSCFKKFNELDGKLLFKHEHC